MQAPRSSSQYSTAGVGDAYNHFWESSKKIYSTVTLKAVWKELLKQALYKKERNQRKINKSFSIASDFVIIVGLIFHFCGFVGAIFMILVFMVLALIFSCPLIVLDDLRLRQTQIFLEADTLVISVNQVDRLTKPIRKMLTLAISIALFILLLFYDCFI